MRFHFRRRRRGVCYSTRATAPDVQAAELDLGPPTVEWHVPTRHTLRDPVTGRYTARKVV